ncbi:YjjG family noncanonical pyrimidine nucleotidase [Roseivirga echinicomitans]
MKNYKHIFFDLDHTLWDYDTNAQLALHELYDHYKFEQHVPFNKDTFVQSFFEVNNELWSLFNRHQIQREHIRERRFATIFERLKTKIHIIPQQLDFEYVELCPTKSAVFEGAHDILDYLKERYQLHIITNGFDDVQTIKMKSAKLDHYFDVIVTSENSMSRKPSAPIFEQALQRTGAILNESIMIGDNLESDIQGARDFGMDHVWFNPTKQTSDFPPTYEIQMLSQLRNLL